jgi:hypothetical protein
MRILVRLTACKLDRGLGEPRKRVWRIVRDAAPHLTRWKRAHGDGRHDAEVVQAAFERSPQVAVGVCVGDDRFTRCEDDGELRYGIAGEAFAGGVK